MSDKKPKRPRDIAQLAKHVVDLATGQVQEKSPDAEAAARGSKGGKKRAQSLSSEDRRDIAKHAANARWSEKKD